MRTKQGSKSILRILFSLLVLGVMVFSAARPVLAASPTVSIVSIKADDSVTIRVNDAPAHVTFTVRMDVVGNRAENGIIVERLDTGSGGSIEATYKIPGELKGKKQIAIRVESSEGYFAYNWFNNNTQGPSVTATPAPTSAAPSGNKPRLTFSNVKANSSVTVEGWNLPANTTFTVRVGPYYTFFKEYAKMASVNSDANGYVKFDISLPSVVNGVERVTVRLDGGGRYAYNAFINVDGGTGVPVTSGGTTSSTSVCQVTLVSPNKTLTTRADFDGAWTVKNTSGKTWSSDAVDFKYVSGTKMHQNGDVHDLTQEVKSGDSVKIVVDMLAPDTAGTYSTNWALVQGGSTLCTLPLTVRVK
jgi:hypothetical protein